jgi:hypothetical protein
MNDNIDIGEIDRRARTAGYADGLVEIFAALVLGTLALSWWVSPGIVGVMAALVAIFGWRAVERLKVNVTYPRIGYHRERGPDTPDTTLRGMLLFIGGAFVLMALVVLLSGGISDVSEWRRAAPLLSGVSLAGGLWYVAQQSDLMHFRLIAAWSVASAVLVWWFGTGESYAGVSWHLIGVALPLGAIGIWSLIRFLRSHPLGAPSADG